MLTAYHSLKSLSATLNLPCAYLKRLADGGQIPFLMLPCGRRFEEQSVIEALRRIAATESAKAGQR
jgi:hypothetical protein